MIAHALFYSFLHTEITATATRTNEQTELEQYGNGMGCSKRSEGQVMFRFRQAGMLLVSATGVRFGRLWHHQRANTLCTALLRCVVLRFLIDIRYQQ